MNEQDPRLEALADALLAGDDPWASTPPTGSAPTMRSLRDTCSMAVLALTADTEVAARLHDRLAADALRHCARQRPRSPVPTRAPVLARRSPWPILLAAAASVLLTLWITTGRDRPLDPAQERARLLAAGTGLLRQDWKAGPGPSRGAVEGDVVWSDAEQRGVMRLRGLPPAPTGRQFQLWIVDGERDGAPVDGGLFDVADSGEALVPVQAKLHIGKAAAFVITVERRGGVVVSKQDDVVAIAGL